MQIAAAFRCHPHSSPTPPTGQKQITFELPGLSFKRFPCSTWTSYYSILFCYHKPYIFLQERTQKLFLTLYYKIGDRNIILKSKQMEDFPICHIRHKMHAVLKLIFSFHISIPPPFSASPFCYSGRWGERGLLLLKSQQNSLCSGEPHRSHRAFAPNGVSVALVSSAITLSL